MIYLSDKQVAEITGIARQTLRNWRSKGRGPAYVKIGRIVRYPKDELENFMRRCFIDPERKGGQGAEEDQATHWHGAHQARVD